MKARFIKLIALLLCIVLVLPGCTRTKTLKQVLDGDPNALKSLPYSTEPIVCRDYTVYNTGGGIDDAINATRYSSGLLQTNSRYVNYQYVVQDNQTKWKYIFENHRDIPVWVNYISLESGKTSTQLSNDSIPIKDAKKELEKVCLNRNIDVKNIKHIETKQSQTSGDVIFHIEDIHDYCTHHYSAVVTYVKKLNWEYQDCDITQQVSEFNHLGVWQYNDGETEIWVNFLTYDGIHYDVEYKVTYYKRTWTSSGLVSLNSNGITQVYGSNQSDENREKYLQIVLRTYDEKEGWIEAGWLAIYPYSGVYWNTTNDVGGPFKLK